MSTSRLDSRPQETSSDTPLAQSGPGAVRVTRGSRSPRGPSSPRTRRRNQTTGATPSRPSGELSPRKVSTTTASSTTGVEEKEERSEVGKLPSFPSPVLTSDRMRSASTPIQSASQNVKDDVRSRGVSDAFAYGNSAPVTSGTPS